MCCSQPRTDTNPAGTKQNESGPQFQALDQIFALVSISETSFLEIGCRNEIWTISIISLWKHSIFQYELQAQPASIKHQSINQSLISGIFCAEWREQILGVGSWCDCSDRHLIKNQNEIGNTAEAGNSWSSTATWGVWEFTTNSQDSTTNRAVFSLCVKLKQ